MTEPRTVQAWFQGGPAAGMIRLVECGVDGYPPTLLMFCGGQLFVGASQDPVPSTYAMYELEQVPVDGGLSLYRHAGSLVA